MALVDEGTTRPTVPADRPPGRACRCAPSTTTSTASDSSSRPASSLQADPPPRPALHHPATRPSELRITALCRQRRFYFEEVTPIRRLALSRSTHRRDSGDARWTPTGPFFGDQLAHTLAPELGMRGDHGPDLLDALEHATGWDAWNGLRGRTGPLAHLGRAGHGPHGDASLPGT